MAIPLFHLYPEFIDDYRSNEPLRCANKSVKGRILRILRGSQQYSGSVCDNNDIAGTVNKVIIFAQPPTAMWGALEPTLRQVTTLQPAAS